MPSSVYIIYALVDPLTKEWRYLGKSARGLVRCRDHLIEARANRRRSYKLFWIRSLLSRGLNYIVEIVEECPTEERLNVAEQEWIAEARRVGVKLTNMTDGGDGGLSRKGTKHSSKALERMRAAQSNRSSEVRKRMSKAMRLRCVHYPPGPMPQTTRDKIAAAHKGRPKKPSTVALLTGRKRSEATRARIAKARLGTKQSAETVAARVAKLIGRKPSRRDRCEAYGI